jgi:cyclin-dependent kinase
VLSSPYKSPETFRELEKLGQGSFGTVMKARQNSNGRIVAIKKTKSEVQGIPYTSIREISILKELASCPFIIQYAHF